MWKRVTLCLYTLVWIGIIAFIWDPSSVLPSHGEPVTLQLHRGPFTYLNYHPRSGTTALIVFASGDGGWNSLEESIARKFQDHGFNVIGIDSKVYAQTDYDLDSLQSDFSKIVQQARTSYGAHQPPLIMAGYSMGAAQMTAVTAGPHPPSGITGLLVVDMCARGRYGLRTSDQLNVLPTGPGTFAVDDFARNIKTLRVVQWHASEDTIDSRAWLTLLSVPYREFDFPGTGHEYESGRDEFVHRLVDSSDWLLGKDFPAAVSVGHQD
jgi:phosphatidylglycerol lysyltransferase